MHLDPGMPALVGSLTAILLLGLVLRRLRQPYVVAYLIAGVVLGPHGLSLITDEATLGRMGAIGVMLLLFFVGMEVSPERLVKRWRVPVLGTALQIGVSIGAAALIARWMSWPWQRAILVGFVISLSSTAVVIKVLEDSNELDSDMGQDVLGVLLVQDLALIPMLVVIGLLGGADVDPKTAAIQIGGGAALLGMLVFLAVRPRISLPLAGLMRGDRELQVFTALVICFGFSLLTALAQLSAALGAFAAGILIGAAKEEQWVHESLEPFRVVFVALFFVSIGLLVDLDFLWAFRLQIGLLVVAVLLTNTLINAVIFRLLGGSWRRSLYAGALLSQVGEFSFVLAAVGLQAGLISDFGYQLALAVIALSLLGSTICITALKPLLRTPEGNP